MAWVRVEGSPAAVLLEESTMIPKMTRHVPTMFWRVHSSPKKNTANRDENNGEVLTIGAERATPIFSMPT